MRRRERAAPAAPHKRRKKGEDEEINATPGLETGHAGDSRFLIVDEAGSFAK